MGGSAFQSGTLGGIPSLPSVLDFLAAKWLQETDLNRRHTAYEAAVLPLHHPAMCRGLTVPRRYKIGDMPRLGLERIAGIEPTCSARKADVLPLNYTRVCPRRGYVKGDDAAGLSRLSGRNIVIKMERFALIGFLPFPVHARFWGM